MKDSEPRQRGAHWVIRATMPNKDRPFIPLGPRTMSQALAEARAEHWFENRERLERAYMETVERRSAERVTTVAQLADLWTSGKMLETYGRVNRLRKRRGERGGEVAYNLTRAMATRPRGAKAPTFGELAVADVTERDIEAVLRLAPRAGAASSSHTLRNYYGALHRLFDLAERPCRLRPRDSNPVDPSMRPTLDDEKVFSFLLPDELLAVLAVRAPIHDEEQGLALTADDVLAFKVLIVLGTYLGLRKSNLVGLRWCDVDLDGGTFVSLRTKTGVPIVADVHFAGVLTMLKKWKEHSKPKTSDAPIVPITDRRSRRAKQVLHAMLRAAGVKREILFSDDPSVAPIRFHDLRSTFVTWAKRAGLSDHFISSRTGHLTKEMIERYTKLATSVSAARFTPFPNVSDAISELRDDGTSSGSGGGNGVDVHAQNAVEQASEALARLAPAPVFKPGSEDVERADRRENERSGSPRSRESSHVSTRDPVADPRAGHLIGLRRCVAEVSAVTDAYDRFALAVGAEEQA